MGLATDEIGGPASPEEERRFLKVERNRLRAALARTDERLRAFERTAETELADRQQVGSDPSST